jgi:hypothetical protein
MFQIKSLLISFYTFFNYHNFINKSSLINLSFISITFLYFLFCDFNYLDYNIFQDIYCDGINDDQILDLNNRHIENSDNS